MKKAIAVMFAIAFASIIYAKQATKPAVAVIPLTSVSIPAACQGMTQNPVYGVPYNCPLTITPPGAIITTCKLGSGSLPPGLNFVITGGGSGCSIEGIVTAPPPAAPSAVKENIT